MEIELSGSFKGRKAEYDPKKIVELSDGYYMKTDVTHVVNIDGRYYRKTSPLIKELDHSLYGRGLYVLASRAIETYSNQWVLASETATVCDIGKDGSVIDGIVLHRNESTVRVMMADGTNIRIPRRRTESGYFLHNYSMDASSGFWFPNELGIKLSDKYAKGTRYFFSANGDTKELVKHDGEYYLLRDCSVSYNEKGEVYKVLAIPIFGMRLDNRIHPHKRIKVFKDVISSSKAGKLSTIDLANAILNGMYLNLNIDSEIDVSLKQCKFGFEVLSSEVDDMNEIYHKLASSRACKESIKGLSDGSFGTDWFGKYSIEKNPEIYFRRLDQNRGGDFVFYKPRGGRKVDLSSDLDMTGNLGYTYGVELETSFGITPMNILDEIGLEAVGDRSIGSLEYVTRPLHGNNGIDYIYDILQHISKYCKIDDRCGVHVHVGGTKGSDNPKFSRDFSILSIMLGTQIEEEMFELLPSDRRSRTNGNGLAYCGSILDYKDTNLNNGLKKLSHYVFGDENGFQPGGSDERTELNRWVSSRYKWLNLVNCNTSNAGRRGGGGFKTIEFRQYNGSLDINEIRAYILLSLAFVNFVDNHASKIVSGGCSLDSVIDAIPGESSRQFLREWKEERRHRVLTVINDLPKRKSPKPRTSTILDTSNAFSIADSFMNDDEV